MQEKSIETLWFGRGYKRSSQSAESSQFALLEADCHLHPGTSPQFPGPNPQQHNLPPANHTLVCQQFLNRPERLSQTKGHNGLQNGQGVCHAEPHRWAVHGQRLLRPVPTGHEDDRRDPRRRDAGGRPPLEQLCPGQPPHPPHCRHPVLFPVAHLILRKRMCHLHLPEGQEPQDPGESKHTKVYHKNFRALAYI